MDEETVTRILDSWSVEWLVLPDEAARRAWWERQDPTQAVSLLPLLLERTEQTIRSDPQTGLGLADLAVQLTENGADKARQGQAQRLKGHALRAVGRYQEALPCYEVAARLFAEAGQNSEEGRTYLGQLAVLSSLGNYGECLRQGRQVRRRLLKLADRLNIARLDSNLAIVYHLTGRYQTALRLHNRAILEFEALGQPDLIPATRLNRANTLWQLNRFREAAQDYEDCRQVFEEKGQRTWLAIVDTNLGFLLFSQGRYNEALDLLSAARQGFETTGQTDKRALAEIDLAACYSTLGLYSESLSLYEQAGQTLTALGSKYEALRAELGRSNILLYLGRYHEAEILLDRVLEIYQAAGQDERNEHMLAIGSFYRAQLLARTERAEQAVAQAQAALAVFEQLKLLEWQAQGLLLLADLYRQLARPVEAAQTYQQSEELLKRLKLPHLFYQFYYGRGQLAEATAQTDAALAYYRQAISQFETIRAILRPEELRTAFMENGLGAYERLVTLCIARGDPLSLQEAFSGVEQSKSRGLLDLLTSRINRADENELPAPVAAQLETLRQELNWYYSRLHTSNSEGSSGGGGGPENNGQRRVEIEGWQVQLEKSEQALAALLRQYRPGLLDSPAQTQPTVLLSQIQSQLGLDESLLEYYLLDDELLAFVVVGGELKVYRNLVRRAEIEELQERLEFQFNKFRLSESYRQRHAAALQQAMDFYLTQLYQWLIAPLRADLAGSKLIIIPHGPLHSLPLHAARDETGRYLIETYQLSYAPSARVWQYCQSQPVRPYEKLLAVGVSDPRLAGIEAEVREVSQNFPQPRILIGPAASRAGLQSNLEWCDVLHLASHGLFRQDNPLFSLLKLSDGWLSVAEIMGWRFQPALVTLSACQTGLSRPLRGDELVGLARAFFSAGASSLLVSLWAVSDEATRRLMAYFYQELEAGASPAAALKAAQLVLRADPAYQHPYYWAAFAVMGRS